MRTVLYGIPEAPPYVINITRVTGIYVVGMPNYIGRAASIINSFHRSIDTRNNLELSKGTEEFITGVLAVILISFFAEIVQTALLRKQKNSVNSNGLRVAYMLDEFSHFRDLWRRMTRQGPRRKNMFSSAFNGYSILSILVLVLAIFIFLADVMTVFLIQSRTFKTTAEQLNLLGMHPVATTEGIARKVRFTTLERPCVLPMTKFQKQTRHFRLAGCVEYDEGVRIPPPDDNPDTVTLQSWYHEGGSDHNVSFAETWYSIRTRAMVYLERDQSMKRILFNRSITWKNDTQFLHNRTMFNAMQISCNGKKPDLDCEEIVEKLRHEEELKTKRDIFLWERDGKPVRRMVEGLTSRYTVSLSKPGKTIRRAMQVLAASTAVFEVRGPGMYEDDQSGEREQEIAGLVSEEGRNAGMILLLVLVASFGVLLLFLRILLDPISLAEIAMIHELATQKARQKRNSRSTKRISKISRIETVVPEESL